MPASPQTASEHKSGCRVTSLPGLLLEPVTEVRVVREVPLAQAVRFSQIIVTGPPGAGKSTLVRQLGGWPEEGFVDLTRRGWWRAETLAMRPREVHLGLPFLGHQAAIALFDDAWQRDWKTLVLDPSRVQLPRPKRHLFSVDWLGRFVFEFLLPPPERIYADRCVRAREGTHPVDERIDLEQIRTQVALYCAVLALFHRHGMQVYVRQRLLGRPLRLCGHSGDQAGDQAGDQSDGQSGDQAGAQSIRSDHARA